MRLQFNLTISQQHCSKEDPRKKNMTHNCDVQQSVRSVDWEIAHTKKQESEPCVADATKSIYDSITFHVRDTDVNTWNIDDFLRNGECEINEKIKTDTIHKNLKNASSYEQNSSDLYRYREWDRRLTKHAAAMRFLFFSQQRYSKGAGVTGEVVRSSL